MKILVCCGSGLGSSFMMEINIKNVLKELGMTDIEVSHSDLSSATKDSADVFVATRDIAPEVAKLGETISLKNMIDKKELTEKLTAMLQEKGLL